jgi:hypothetical protein
MWHPLVSGEQHDYLFHMATLTPDHAMERTADRRMTSQN